MTEEFQEKLEWTGLAKFLPVLYTYLMLFALSYFYTNVHFSSNLVWKYSGLTFSLSLHVLTKAPMSNKIYIK